jgi:hypothetical protein
LLPEIVSHDFHRDAKPKNLSVVFVLKAVIPSESGSADESRDLLFLFAFNVPPRFSPASSALSGGHSF